MTSQKYKAHRAKMKRLKSRQHTTELFELMGMTLAWLILGTLGLASSFHLLSMYL